MIPQHIIELAIKGGWKKGWRFDHVDAVFIYMEKTDASCKQPIVSWMWERVALDPLFWQSLGKELDWRTVGPARNQNDHEPDWYWNARKFFDLLLTSGDTSAFWQSISDKK